MNAVKDAVAKVHFLEPSDWTARGDVECDDSFSHERMTRVLSLVCPESIQNEVHPNSVSRLDGAAVWSSKSLSRLK